SPLRCDKRRLSGVLAQYLQGCWQAGDKAVKKCYPGAAVTRISGEGRQMTLHTGRHFLQIPGPTNIPDRVLRAMDMPGMDHRSAEFAELGFALMAAAQRMFRTKQPVLIYPSSGTGAWEAAIVNALSPGDKVLMA